MTAVAPSPSPGLSFQGRITVAAMLTTVTVLLAACCAFVAEQWRSEMSHLVAKQADLVRVLAGGDTIKRVYRGQPNQAPNVALRMLRVTRGTAVYLLDANGRVIGHAGPADPAQARRERTVESRAPVVVDGMRRAGELIVFVEPPTLWSILPRYLTLSIGLLTAALGLSLILGRWLAARVTTPIQRLSKAMNEVAESGDFSRRVERTADDELGRLTDAFNDLLAKLRVKDEDLGRTVAELVAARDAADIANIQKSQFLANMSHEIRTPLNGLLAMTQVMALDDLGPVQQERLSVIRNSGEALLAILNDVLDVSKIEAGKLELEVGEFDVAQVISGVQAGFAAVAEKKSLALAVEIDPSARDLRAGDAQRLCQILNNLVSNALKFTHEGEVRLTVRGEGPDGAEGLRLAVSDTGIGIPAEVAPLLFQKFSQGDSSTTRKFGGTGLGLAICAELSELMGGRIWLESVEGQGSIFHLVLPLPRVGAALSEPLEAPVQAQPSEEDRALRVLAAEDNPTNQLVLKTIMGVFGISVDVVDNGRKAVEAWGAGTYDMILMDIQMPEMDGLTATRAIRAAEAREGRVRIPIIALSAHAMTHQVQEYLDAGVDLHVPKPIELPRLQAALEAAVTQAEAAREAAGRNAA